MLDKIQIHIADLLDKKSIKIKKSLTKRNLQKFIQKYELTEIKKDKKVDLRFNPYECTNLYMIDALIESKEINTTDYILDIGSGTGIALIYLASKGFTNLFGIEHNKKLFDIAQNNLLKIPKNMRHISFFNEDALEFCIDDQITCFYLFNTFYDKNTYLDWLNRVKESLERNKRKIKIIILFPTVASMGAMRDQTWLIEKGRILCSKQVCYRCVNYVIYEGKL